MKRRKRKSTNLWETWYEWFACRAYSTEADRQWKSTMRRCVAYMLLFVDTLDFDIEAADFRDQVLQCGKQIAANVQAFLLRHSITCSSTGAVEKKFRALHKAGKLNSLIRDYDARVAAGLILDTAPSCYRPDPLKQIVDVSAQPTGQEATAHQS